MLLEVGECPGCDLLAPFLQEVAALDDFQRWWAAADKAVQRAHDGWAENGVFHADRHQAPACPVVAPEVPGLAGERSAAGVGAVRDQVGKAPHAGLVGDIGEGSGVGGSLGVDANFGRKLRGLKVTEDELEDYVERLANRYLEQRSDGERFTQWVHRADEADLQ